MNKDLKSIVISINLDNLLKYVTKAPARCARNIIELGFATTLNKNLLKQKETLEQKLRELLQNNKISEIKEWFFTTFF